MLVGRHTIFQYFLVKSDLCSLRPFRLHSSEKDAEYQNNHKKVESERTRFCVLTIFKIENMYSYFIVNRSVHDLEPMILIYVFVQYVHFHGYWTLYFLHNEAVVQ